LSVKVNYPSVGSQFKLQWNYLFATDYQLRNFIIDFIKAHPPKVTEYQLLSHIENERPQFFDSCSQRPCLFKKHFKLFNLLYAIDDQLILEGMKLNISALNISLISNSTSKTQVGEFDLLRDFYLDEKNFDLDESEISEMLELFWRKILANQDLSQYLKVLQISQNENFDRNKVKRQFNKLAFELHPDRGGSAAQFSELRNAFKQVMRTLK
jgi:DNA-J related protein